MKKTRFYMMLTADNTAIKASRAKQLFEENKDGLAAVVAKHKANYNKAKYELDRLKDLAPLSTDALTYRDDIKSEEWVSSFESAVINLIPLKAKYDALKAEYEDYFIKDYKESTEDE